MKLMTAARMALLFRVSFLIFSVPQIDSVASKQLCQNNGQIVEDDSKVSCKCPYPFTGKYCEDFACVNGLSTGDQYNPGSIFFNKRCLCDPGWTGELCETSLINRCGDNGVEWKGKCKCTKNFVGDRCQYVTKCVHGQLYNGRCACHYGWSGDYCDAIICHNGKPSADHQSCICPRQYRGKYCDFCAKSASSPPPECAETGRSVTSLSNDHFPLLLAVFFTLLFILIGALIYFLCQKFSKQQKSKIVQQRQRNDAEANQSTTANGEETRALFVETSFEKVSMPPKYEDIVPISEKNHKLEKNIQ